LEKLEALGFEWDARAALWEKRFSELVRYKEVHRDCDVPQSWNENPELGTWTATLRSIYRRGKLSPDKVERLEALGFKWDPHAALWEKMFSELVRYKEVHRDCDVPQSWNEIPELGIWVYVQRRAFKSGKLSPDKVERLEALGFKWDAHTAFWEKMFSELIRYKEVHRDCDVPQSWNEIPELGIWVSNQRSIYRRGKLSPEKVEKLESLEFEWDQIAALWERMLSELVRFKEEHGDCNVPRGWSENPALGTWVTTQRTRAKKGRMTDDRHRRLEEIGFRF